MTLVVRVWWPSGVYDAASVDPSRPEWPPAPARLFSALRSGARSGDDLTALRWLETLSPPRIHADRHGMAARRHAGYVVVNAVQRGGGNLSHPGRDNGLRARAGTTLASPEVFFVWPDVVTEGLMLERLDKLAAKVPYLGRSTSQAIVSVDDTWTGDARPAWVPVSLGRGDAVLPVPFPGLLDLLDAAYTAGERACDSYRTSDYRFDDGVAYEAPPRLRTVRAPYSAPLVLRLPEGVHLAGTVLGAVTAALRRAVLSIMPEPIPSVVSGHGADGLPHVGYLGLVDVGHQHADGHILALGVISPRGDARVGEALADALLVEPGLRELRVPGLGSFELTYDPVRDRPRGATADRWIGPSRSWVSATPAVLDRHPRRSLTEAEIMTQGIVAAGYPAPVQVEVLAAPLIRGSQRLRRHQVPQRRGDRRPVRHIRIGFDDCVEGPVLVGALRHLGFGMCAPEVDAECESSAAGR